jgi:hypothetical protein
MTSCVTLSRARPRKPFRSPARIQRGRELSGPGVDRSLSRGDLPGQLSSALGEAGAPGEASAVVGDLAKAELEDRPEPLTESQPHAVRLPFPMVIVFERDLDAGIDPLGVGGEEVSQPACNLLIRAARKHAGILAPAIECDRPGTRDGEPAAWFPRRGQGRGRISTR